MSLPEYDFKNKNIQHLFYLELKKQIDEIDKIENRQERARKKSRLRLEVYKAINLAKSKKNKNTFFDNIKKIVYIIFYKIANIFGYMKDLNKK